VRSEAEIVTVNDEPTCNSAPTTCIAVVTATVVTATIVTATTFVTTHIVQTEHARD